MSSLTTLVTKTPLPTQVEEVELKHSTQSHVREKGKTVRFKLCSTNMNKPKSNWKRRLAKSQHTMLNEDAKQKLQDYRRIQRAERKHERKKYKPSIVMDSAATSTVLREYSMKSQTKFIATPTVPRPRRVIKHCYRITFEGKHVRRT